MQFSQLLKLNVIPKWSDHYLSYSSLKQLASTTDITRESNDEFTIALEEQLNKVTSFYNEQETKVFAEIEQLELELKGLADNNDNHSIEESELNSLASFKEEDDHPILDLKNQVISIYVAFTELASFLFINKRILEELTSNTNEKSINHLFLQSESRLQNQIQRIEMIYAERFCKGLPTDTSIKSHLQQQILIGNWKKDNTTAFSLKNHHEEEEIHIKERGERYYRLPYTSFKMRSTHLFNLLYFTISSLIFIVLLSVHLFDNKQENACFALLIFSALLWATEAIPLYATSMMIPFFIVILNILQTSEGTPMPAKMAAKSVFSAMFSGTVLMLLGGFSLAAALSKYGIARRFAVTILQYAGTRVQWILLAFMLVAGILSMFISNVATPVLCFSLIEEMANPDVAPCLIIGIALASNIGGMISPIASPQNIITVQYLAPNPGWGLWMAVSLPISILCIVSCWGILLLYYKPKGHLRLFTTSQMERYNYRHVFIFIVSLTTIGLWCAASAIEDRLGDTGIIATLPLFLFFSTGILKKEDLHHRFLWSVVILAQGGMALGHAVTSCGLLQDIAVRIKNNMSHLSVFEMLVLFSIFILIFSTFVSHTVAALIIVPIVKEVGEKLPIPHPNLFVMGAGLACSAGMGLPVSGFPNMSAAMLERPGIERKPYLTTRDFFVTGVPTSVICTILIFTLGFAIMTLIGY